MSETTDRLSLPFLVAQQSQKHVTHNEALRRLDVLVNASVISAQVITPPLAPSDSEGYLIPAGATDAFENRTNELAFYQDGAWVFLTPQAGWLCYVESGASFLLFDGASWNPITIGNEFQTLGVNTSPDEVNRLAVKTQAALFSYDDVNSAVQDIRVNVNKAAAGATASLVFQSNWSGRAEMGLAGSDDFSFKVSADGVTFLTALEIDGATGIVSEPQKPVLAVGNVLTLSAVTGGYQMAWSDIKGGQSSLYDAATGLFTAPIDGLYRVSLSALTANDTLAAGLSLFVNGSSYGAIASVPAVTTAAERHLSGVTVLYLTAQDTLSAVADVNTLQSVNDFRNQFSIEKID